MRSSGVMLSLLSLTMVPPALGDTVTAPSYWDAIFQLGYDPATGTTTRHALRVQVVGPDSAATPAASTDRRRRGPVGASLLLQAHRNHLR